MLVAAESTQPWWVLIVRGIAAIVFGLGALFWPGITLVVLITLYGAYAIVDGVIALVGSFQAAERHRRWWPLVLRGIVSILAGVIALVLPAITALVLLFIIAAWAIIAGILELAAGLRFGSWLLDLAGVVSLIFGVVLIAFPGAGIMSVLWLVGVFALAVGVILLIYGISLRTAPTQPAL